MGWFGGNKNKKSDADKQTRATSSVVAASYPSPPPHARNNNNPQYMSPQPPADVIAPPKKEKDSVERRSNNEEAAIMVIDQEPFNVNKARGASPTSEQTPASYTKDEEMLTHVGEGPRQSHLNSLFNGHLMKWKYEAEEGSAFIRVPAFLGAIGLLISTVLSFVLYPDALVVHNIVMSCCIVIMATFILILDGRWLSNSPLSARAHLRNVITRNFNVFRFLWGRGLLYIVAGILAVAEMQLIMIVSGSFMILVGVLAICVGVHASRKFAALRNSLADESFLLLVFSNYDADGDGFITPSEFSWLLTDLGMELDDRYTLKAFNVIDSDNDRLISFDEFNHWWSSGYVERGRRRRDEEADDVSYRRMY